MTIRAQIAHETAGRVRVRLPDLRGNAELLAQLESQLMETRLFRSVRVNPVTTSVVLEFDGSRASVLDALRERLPVELELSPASTAGRAPPASRFQNDPVRLVTGRDVNAMFLAGVLFGTVGIVQALRGKIMLPAMSAFWCAGSAFRLARTRKGDQAAAVEATATSG